MKDFIGFLKLPAYLLGALAVASGILLFAPDNVIQMLYMTDFRTEYGFGIGIVFIVSVSILTVMLIRMIYRGITRKYHLQRLKEEQEKFLLKLDMQKVGLIKEFLRQPTRTLVLPMHDGLVIELQHFDVISPAGSTHMVSMPNPEIPFFLQPWVKEQIEANEELQRKFYC